MSSFWIEKKGSDLILHNKYGVYSKNELEYQLRLGHLTIRELGQAYNLTHYQIVHVFRSLGITYHNQLHDTRVIDSTIQPEMHQVIIGTLLGDAYMTEPRTYQVAHSIYQMDYLYHVASQLSPFVATIGDRKSKTGESVFLWTYRHNILEPYFDRFYSHGKTKKYFTEETVKDLNPIGLAYWYMDDGKYDDYGAYLCVGNITSEEGNLLITYLKNNFSIEATFQIHDKKKNYHNLYIKAESRNHFFELITPYVISSMSYKIIGGSPPKNFSEEDLINKHINLCERVQRPIRYAGRTSINDIILSKVNKLGYKQLFINKIQGDMKNGRQISSTHFREIPSEEDLKKMFIEEGKTDDEVAQCTGYGRTRIARLRVSLGLPRKKCRKIKNAF